MTDILAQRLTLGRAAVLSVAEAIRLLPWRDSTTRQWLDRHGLITRRPDMPGPCVVWGHVIDAMERDEVQQATARPVRAWRLSEDV